MCKKIYDVIHGFIEIPEYIVKIIDTVEFQRLRYIKQLGAASYVFPSATHTRFAHSIGVFYLASNLIKNLQKNHPEKEISDRHVMLIEIAALIHDLGHGPFSHLWDHYVIYKDDDEHEVRGLNIFKEMVQKYDIGITRSEFDIICELVNPTIESNKKNWYYQIVANKNYQLDVDKLDYIQRDSFYIGNIGMIGNFERLITDVRIVTDCNGNEQLGWDKKLSYELFSVFTTRFKLHKLVYNHHTVKSHEYMLIHILREFYEKMKQGKISFLNLTDNLITTSQHLLNSDVCPVKQDNKVEIIDIIHSRRSPKFLGEVIISENHPNFKKITEQSYPQYKINLLIDKIDMGFSSNDKNPMEDILYYDKKKFNEIKQLRRLENVVGERKNSSQDSIPDLEGFKNTTSWCKTEFKEIKIICFIIGSLEVEKANKELWELYLKENNLSKS